MENKRFEFTATEMDATKLGAKEIEGLQHATDAIGAALAELDRMSQTLVVE